jgi:hypothetical protein
MTSTKELNVLNELLKCDSMDEVRELIKKYNCTLYSEDLNYIFFMFGNYEYRFKAYNTRPSYSMRKSGIGLNECVEITNGNELIEIII